MLGQGGMSGFVLAPFAFLWLAPFDRFPLVFLGRPHYHGTIRFVVMRPEPCQSTI